ncbi:MAG: NERD domain-containing protein [Bacteroidales bacterium]|nr:NERD domain-containing protein [Bacteroidales bacterium]
MSETSIIIIGVAAVILLLILLRLILPGKGTLGEKRVCHILSKLPKERYEVFNDVMLKTGHGTTQIDHIVVSRYGVFVIETKSLSGWIYGSEDDKYWTQNIYGNKYQVYNPVFQNSGHIRALRKILDDDGKIFIYSIVAFSRKASLRIYLKESCVIYWRQLRRTIESFSERKLSDEQVCFIGNKIYENRIDTNEKGVKKAHKKSVKAARKYSESRPFSKTCPKCGGHLSLKHGKFGDFYGCSNYPQCSYTRRIQ